MLEKVRCRIEKCVKFSDLYDHKNLKYFMTVKKLTERQMRWSLILLQYNFFILYLLSKQNEKADALLRQEQNVSMNLSDDRVQHCTTQIICSEMISKSIHCLNDSSRHISLCACTRSELVQWDYRPQTDVSECWSRRWVVQWALSDNLQETKIIFYCFKSEGIHNKMLLEMKKATFAKDTECCLRILCTELIQYTHDSTMTEHSERTDALLSQQFFWPEMLQNVCTFCWN
jgi:hypothetical protein